MVFSNDGETVIQPNNNPSMTMTRAQYLNAMLDYYNYRPGEDPNGQYTQAILAEMEGRGTFQGPDVEAVNKAIATGGKIPDAGAAGLIDKSAGQIQGYDTFQEKLASGLDAAKGRVAPTINQAPQEQFRGTQLSLAQQLHNQAQGIGPSLAQMQLKQASDRNLAQAMALGQSTGGAGLAGAQRNIANRQANIGQQLAMDSGLLRLQEQQQAQKTLADVLGQGRGQDIGMATAQAGLEQQQTAINDALVKYYMQAGIDLATAQQRAKMDMEALLSNTRLGVASNMTQREGQTMSNALANTQLAQQQSDSTWNKVLGGVGAAGGVVAALSAAGWLGGKANNQKQSTSATGNDTSGMSMGGGGDWDKPADNVDGGDGGSWG